MVKHFISLIIILLCSSSLHAAGLDGDYEQEYDYFTSQDTQYIDDPFERANRIIFDFNLSVDKKLVKPIAQQYSGIKTPWLSEMIHNFTDNLQEPSNFINSLLIGDIQAAINAFWRFYINSIFGIFGFFDVAEAFDLHKTRNSFEDTMLYYGVNSGPYMVLPFLEPSSFRGIIASVLESVVNPLLYIIDNFFALLAVKVVFLIPQREAVLGIDIDSGVDLYIKWRNIFSQRLSR